MSEKVLIVDDEDSNLRLLNPGFFCQTGRRRKERLPYVAAFKHNRHHGRESGGIAVAAYDAGKGKSDAG